MSDRDVQKRRWFVWKPFDQTEDVHVFPGMGPEHQMSPDCWCEPIVDHQDDESDIRSWMHKELH